MQIGFYPDHFLPRGVGPSQRRRKLATAPAIKSILSVGRSLILGRSVETLSDHLLDDIGLTRADVAALRR